MSECLFPSKISCYKNSKLKVRKNIQEYVLWTMQSKTGWKWVLVLEVSIYQGVSEEAGLWHNGLGETRGWDWGCPHFPPISLLLRRQWWPTKCATKEQFKAQRVALTSHQYRRNWEDSKRFNHQYPCYWYCGDGKRFNPLQVLRKKVTRNTTDHTFAVPWKRMYDNISERLSNTWTSCTNC